MLGYQAIVCALFVVAGDGVFIVDARPPAPKGSTPHKQSSRRSALAPILRCPLAAPPAPNGLVHIVAAIDESDARPTLIGSSGELFHANGTGTWIRSTGGGVSTDVRTVFRGDADTLFALGERAPLFVRTAGLWSVSSSVPRGFASFSRGPHAVISVGHNLYHLDSNQWLRIGRAKSKIHALWASTSDHFFLATADRALYVGSASKWVSIPHTLPETERIVTLLGVPGAKRAVAITTGNQVLWITPKSVRPLVPPTSLQGLVIHAVGMARNQIILAGTAGQNSTHRSVLVAVHQKNLQELTLLWPLAADDRFAIVFEDHNNTVTIATQYGQIKTFAPDGTWHNGALTVENPTPLRDSAQQGPAISR